MEKLSYPIRDLGEVAHWIGHGKVEVSIIKLKLCFFLCSGICLLQTDNTELFDILSLTAINFEGLPAVITFSVPKTDYTLDGVPIAEACRKLEEAGAAVVGFNCGRGPETMIDILKLAREKCKVSSESRTNRHDKTY